MRFSFKSACAVLCMSLACEFGCGSRLANDAPAPTHVASGTESGVVTHQTSRDVPPGAAGDFGFTAPEEGMTTIVIEGDCEKSVLLVSQEWAAAAEKFKAVPGLLEAMNRKDDAEVRRLLEQNFGQNSPVVQIYFTDANAMLEFEAPVGKVERKLHLLKGPHTLAISNQSEKPANISVYFKPTN